MDIPTDFLRGGFLKFQGLDSAYTIVLAFCRHKSKFQNMKCKKSDDLDKSRHSKKIYFTYLKYLIFNIITTLLIRIP